MGVKIYTGPQPLPEAVPLSPLPPIDAQPLPEEEVELQEELPEESIPTEPEAPPREDIYDEDIPSDRAEEVPSLRQEEKLSDVEQFYMDAKANPHMSASEVLQALDGMIQAKPENERPTQKVMDDMLADTLSNVQYGLAPYQGKDDLKTHDKMVGLASGLLKRGAYLPSSTNPLPNAIRFDDIEMQNLIFNSIGSKQLAKAVSEEDHDGSNLINTLACRGNTDALNKIFNGLTPEDRKQVINTRSTAESPQQDEKYPLESAALNGHDKTLQLLIKNGAELKLAPELKNDLQDRIDFIYNYKVNILNLRDQESIENNDPKQEVDTSENAEEFATAKAEANDVRRCLAIIKEAEEQERQKNESPPISPSQMPPSISEWSPKDIETFKAANVEQIASEQASFSPVILPQGKVQPRSRGDEGIA